MGYAWWRGVIGVPPYDGEVCVHRSGSGETHYEEYICAVGNKIGMQVDWALLQLVFRKRDYI